MRFILITLAVATVSGAIGCAGSTTAPSAPTGVTTLAFGALSADGPITIYGENGYWISAAGPWQAKATFGNPAPMIQFITPGGVTNTASVQVFATNHALFTFRSVDVYSSITPIPYVISGTRDFATVWALSDTVPNTFGTFRTISNTHVADVIDTLTIELTNPSTCCSNPMGIDNVVLSR